MLPFLPSFMTTPCKIEEYEVRNLLRRQNSRMAAGPDDFQLVIKGSWSNKLVSEILADILTEVFVFTS